MGETATMARQVSQRERKRFIVCGTHTLSPSKLGRYGSIVYLALGQGGQLLESAGVLYHGCVASYEVRGEREDGIFEPGERIEIQKLVLTNTGGMTMPSGAEIRIHSPDGSILFDEFTQALPFFLQPGNNVLFPILHSSC